MNVLMKNTRRHEGGFTMVELLVVMVVMGVLMAVGVSVMSNMMVGKRSDQIKAVGAALQQWSVAHPDKPVPTTDGYITLSDLKSSWVPKELGKPADNLEDSKYMTLKVLNVENGSSFVVCSEEGSKRNPSYSMYDSKTGEISQDANACK